PGVETPGYANKVPPGLWTTNSAHHPRCESCQPHVVDRSAPFHFAACASRQCSAWFIGLRGVSPWIDPRARRRDCRINATILTTVGHDDGAAVSTDRSP